MTNGRYLIPAQTHQSELEVKKSRFLCHLAHTDNIQSAKDFVEKIKQQYSDATHNCWAYQAGPVGDTREIGCSDDGEPQGTAGRPMLTVLTHANVGEITAVVTRYYGGTKLGTGGLARAYADAVKLALESILTRIKINFSLYQTIIDYSVWPKIEPLLAKLEAEEVTPVFSHEVTVQFRLDEKLSADLNQQLQDLTHGRSFVKIVEE